MSSIVSEHTRGDRKHVRLTSEDSTHALGVLDNVLLVLTRRPPTVESVLRLVTHAERLSGEFPDGIVIVIIPRAPKPALEPGVPRAVLHAWRQLEPKLLCSVVLIRASGVVGALQRHLVSSVLNMRPSAAPVKLTNNPYDAAQWIGRHNQRSLGLSLELGRATAEFLEEYEVAVPSSR